MGVGLIVFPLFVLTPRLDVLALCPFDVSSAWVISLGILAGLLLLPLGVVLSFLVCAVSRLDVSISLPSLVCVFSPVLGIVAVLQ